MQRRREKGTRKEFFWATVSARALIIRLPILGSLAQNGTSPQCSASRLRAPSRSRTAYTVWVGATLWLGDRACSAGGARAPKYLASSSGGVADT